MDSPHKSKEERNTQIFTLVRYLTRPVFYHYYSSFILQRLPSLLHCRYKSYIKVLVSRSYIFSSVFSQEQTIENMEVWSQILVSSLIAYVVVYFSKSLIRWRKLPPGPWGLPFIGYGIFIPYQFEEHLKGLFAKYGKIFTLTIYGQDVVMISDVDLIKRCMLKDVFNYRPHDWFFTLYDKPNLISWNGE